MESFEGLHSGLRGHLVLILFMILSLFSFFNDINLVTKRKFFFFFFFRMGKYNKIWGIIL